MQLQQQQQQAKKLEENEEMHLFWKIFMAHPTQRKTEKAGLFTSIRLLIHLQKMTTMSRLYQLLHLKFVKKGRTLKEWLVPTKPPKYTQS